MTSARADARSCIATTVRGVNRPGARLVLVIVGVVALVVGGVFAGQGLNLIPGSFMTGDRTWLTVGVLIGIALIVVVGIVLIVLGLRGIGRRRSD